MTESSHLKGVFCVCYPSPNSKYRQTVCFIPVGLLGLVPSLDVLGHIASCLLRSLGKVYVKYLHIPIWGPFHYHSISYPEDASITKYALHRGFPDGLLPPQGLPQEVEDPPGAERG